jgi:hypothetical protein
MILEEFKKESYIKSYETLQETYGITVPVEKLNSDITMAMLTMIKEEKKSFQYIESFKTGYSKQNHIFSLIENVLSHLLTNKYFLFEAGRVNIRNGKNISKVYVTRNGVKYTLIGNQWLRGKDGKFSSRQDTLTKLFDGTPQKNDLLSVGDAYYVYDGKNWMQEYFEHEPLDDKTNVELYKQMSHDDKEKAQELYKSFMDNLHKNKRRGASLLGGMVGGFVAGLKKDELETDLDKSKYSKYFRDLHTVISSYGDTNINRELLDELEKHFGSYSTKSKPYIFAVYKRVYAMGIADSKTNITRSWKAIWKIIKQSSDGAFDRKIGTQKKLIIEYFYNLYKSVKEDATQKNHK